MLTVFVVWLRCLELIRIRNEFYGSNKFKFFNDAKKTKTFVGIDSEYFDIYRDEKHIYAYNLSFKKCHVYLDLSKSDSSKKQYISILR